VPRDFYPSSSESGSDDESDVSDNVSGGDGVDGSLPPFVAPSMAAALKEMGIEDEVAPEWSDSGESDAAREMTADEHRAMRADRSAVASVSAAQACDKCARCGLHGHLPRDCTEKVCGNCGRHGHLASDCPKPAACFRCGELGHWVKHCQAGGCRARLCYEI